MHYYTRLYSADHSVRSPIKSYQPAPPAGPLPPASIVAAPLAAATPQPQQQNVAAGGGRDRSGRRSREVYIAPPRPVMSAPMPSPDAVLPSSAVVARLEEEVHSMSRKLDRFVSSMSAVTAAAPQQPYAYPEPLYHDSVHQPPPPPAHPYTPNHYYTAVPHAQHPVTTSDSSYHIDHRSVYAPQYYHERAAPYQPAPPPPHPDAYSYYAPPPPPPSSSFLPLHSSASSLEWYHTQVLPDPQDVAASLYGTGRRSPTHHGGTRRVIPPRPQLSPLRSRHATVSSPPLHLPVVEVPPPPVMPSYPPARDDVEAVAASYAWLALRHLMRDVEDAERRDRIRVLEEELLNLDTLHEAKKELLAVREREQKRERLAALDAEALLRHHLTNVARGELHRERVTEDLFVSHVERESSPEGRYARYVQAERSRSPMPASDRRTRQSRIDDYDDHDEEGYGSAAAALPPSPTRNRRVPGPQPSPYAPDASTIARRSAAAVSFVASSSPPPPAATSQRPMPGSATPGKTLLDRSTPLADLSEVLGYNASIRRDVAAAELVTSEVDNSRARRFKKKMLMQEALR